MDIDLKISEEAMSDLNWAAEIAMENITAGEEVSLEDVREMLVPFVVDKDGRRLEEAQARKLLGRIKNSQSQEVAKKFVSAMQDFLSQRQNGKRALSISQLEAAAPDGSILLPSAKSGAVPPGPSTAGTAD